ncbi:hypothetical protein GIB67_031615, partial [Kingdonia uniflora]
RNYRSSLPAIFTIGPRIDDEDSLLRYAKLISKEKHYHHVNELVQGIIEGETRVLVASMTMEEVFKGTKEFKKEVFDKVQLELNQFGLLIYDANVKQLMDVPGHEYFSYLGQNTQQKAQNQAKIDVAETKMKEADVAEANAKLQTKKADWARQAQLAKVEVTKAVAIRSGELQREVERMNAMTQTEKLRADFLSKASVQYETKVQEANWDIYKKQKVAEAMLYQKEKEAEAQRATASAALYSCQQTTDGEFYKKKKEAEGLVALAEAQEAYLHTLLNALG